MDEKQDKPEVEGAAEKPPEVGVKPGDVVVIEVVEVQAMQSTIDGQPVDQRTNADKATPPADEAADVPTEASTSVVTVLPYVSCSGCNCFCRAMKCRPVVHTRFTAVSVTLWFRRKIEWLYPCGKYMTRCLQIYFYFVSEYCQTASIRGIFTVVVANGYVLVTL